MVDKKNLLIIYKRFVFLFIVFLGFVNINFFKKKKVICDICDILMDKECVCLFIIVLIIYVSLFIYLLSLGVL